MEQVLNITLPGGRKAPVPLITYRAIRQAVRIWRDDRRVASYVAAPHEGITPELVAVIRERMITRGHLTSNAYSRRGEHRGQQ